MSTFALASDSADTNPHAVSILDYILARESPRLKKSAKRHGLSQVDITLRGSRNPARLGTGNPTDWFSRAQIAREGVFERLVFVALFDDQTCSIGLGPRQDQ
jgi:hypothetical protein